MDEYSFLASLSPGDYTDLPGVDPERDAMIARLKARGLVTENIIGGVKLTPAGVAYLSEVQALKQAKQKNAQKTAKEDRQPIFKKRHLNPVFKRILDMLFAVAGTLVAYWIMRRLGW